MPASMISAPVGFRLKVIGSSMAMVATGPIPGSTPMRVPSSAPTRHMKMLNGIGTATLIHGITIVCRRKTSPKPIASEPKIPSMVGSSANRTDFDELRTDREGQRQPLHEHHHREDQQNGGQNDDLLPLEFVATEGADENQSNSGSHQAKRLHQVPVGDATCADQHERLRIGPIAHREKGNNRRAGQHAV